MENPRKSIILVLLQILCLIFILFSGSIVPTAFISQIMILLGIFIGVWAVLSMRRHLTPLPDVKKHAKLIISGPYEIVRHPMYCAMILITFALTLNNLSIPRLFVFFILLCTLVVKLQYEEELLTKRFGDNYKEYKKKTKRIIPYVY